MDDDLLNYLDTLSRGDCYHVDAVLKESAQETTERVYLIAADGSERGPYIRKRIVLDSGLGAAYERLWEAQQSGKRFMHLPRLIECSIEDGYRNVVLEYVEGATLDEATLARGYSPRDAAIMANLLCDAVIELHESFDPPLIHRDLKPSNIVVSRSNLTIIDFGIARTFDQEAGVDTRSFGTRGYAPPEQFGYGQTDERSDVYALGMLIAYCFLREEPSRALVDGGFDDPRIPATLRRALTKATAFDPADRYASVRELQNDLRVSHSIFESPQRPSPLSRVPRWVGTTWNVLVIGVWALFAAVAVSMVFTPGTLVIEGRDVVLPAKAIFIIGIFVVSSAFLLYPFLDKRGIRERLRFLPSMQWLRELIFCFAIGFVFLVVSAIIALFIDNMFAGIS